MIFTVWIYMGFFFMKLIHDQFSLAVVWSCEQIHIVSWLKKLHWLELTFIDLSRRVSLVCTKEWPLPWRASHPCLPSASWDLELAKNYNRKPLIRISREFIRSLLGRIRWVFIRDEFFSDISFCHLQDEQSKVIWILSLWEILGT